MKNIYDIKIDFECPSKIIASPLLVGFFLPQLLSHEWGKVGVGKCFE